MQHLLSIGDWLEALRLHLLKMMVNIRRWGSHAWFWTWDQFWGNSFNSFRSTSSLKNNLLVRISHQSVYGSRPWCPNSKLLVVVDLHPQPIGSIMFHSIVALDPFPVSTASKHREETTSDQRKEQLGMGPLAKWKNTWAYQMPVRFPWKHTVRCVNGPGVQYLNLVPDSAVSYQLYQRFSKMKNNVPPSTHDL